MDADLDTLVTALYVEIDDLLERPSGRGRRPLLTPAELVYLAVMQVLLRFPSERHWLRYARKHQRGRNLEEVSAFLRVPGGTLYQWRYRRTGPRAFKVGRHLR